ncbi:L,D-transpeptidase [Acidipropionibacterium acidipropionici]|nr:L,D-transpeptidase [Acidipropionibacterium acidipropionici]
MWVKAENHVYLVEKGAVTRVMLTTGLPWKTPPGVYSVKYKQRNSSSLDAGHAWTLPYFVAFWRRPGASGDIAFHQVPHDAKGNLAQPLATLGFPGYASDGCARMGPADALAIWEFTKVGTKVVVR